MAGRQRRGVLLDDCRAPLYQEDMSASSNDSAREARLKAALKANIARRKQQARARARSRADGTEDAPNEDIGVRNTGDSTGDRPASSREDRS